jgi:hypothetical protein
MGRETNFEGNELMHVHVIQGDQIGRISQLFTLGSFFKLLKYVVHNVGYFFTRLRFCINFDKKWIGLHFGRFSFTNSSGRPDTISKRTYNDSFVQSHKLKSFLL